MPCGGYSLSRARHIPPARYPHRGAVVPGPHPHLRRRGEPGPARRSRGAACAEGREGQGWLGPGGSGTHPARDQPRAALTWAVAHPHRRGAAPGHPTETALEEKGGRLAMARAPCPPSRAVPCHSRAAHTHPRAARRTAALREAAGSPYG